MKYIKKIVQYDPDKLSYNEWTNYLSESLKKKVIVHDDGYVCCNICEHEEIYNDNTMGVCSTCADNRVEDNIWTKKQRYR